VVGGTQGAELLDDDDCWLDDDDSLELVPIALPVFGATSMAVVELA
jgi:hypothetical protein